MSMHVHGKAGDDEVRAVVLLRALEESDRDGALLPLDARRDATRRAGGDDLDSRAAREDSPVRRAFLASRAAAAAKAMERALPGDSAEWGEERQWPAWLPMAALAAAFLFGWFAEGTGGQRVINLLAFPLLGLIAWNMAILAGLGAGAAWRWLTQHVGGAPAADRVPGGWLVGQVRRIRARRDRAGGHPVGDIAPSGTTAAAGAAVRDRFLRLWDPVLQHRAAALLAASFHGAAAMLVFGLVAVMYVKGFAFQYRAGWESTFLDAPAVHRLFSAAFGPASALTGFRLGVPPVEEVAAGEVSGGGTGIDAAPWIHLYALTALIFVFAPRGVLAWSAWRRATRSGRLAYEADPEGWTQYAGRLLRGLRGGGNVVRVQPFAFQPESRSRDALRRFVADEWGGAAMVEIREPAGYADDPDAAAAPANSDAAGTSDARDGIAWFALGSTPEDEVHGEFFRALRTAAGDGRLLAVLDAGGFRQRIGGLPEFERRLAERCRAWRRVLGPETDLRLLDPGQADEWIRLPSASVPPGRSTAGITSSP